jgi:transcriptional regulator with XRE-family HTH domain
MYLVKKLSHIGFMIKIPEPNEGNRIARVRKEKGVTQQELADKLGVHFVTVSKLERGKMQLTTKWISRIAEALDVDPEEVWTTTSFVDRIALHGGIANGGIQDWDLKKLAGYSIPTEDFFDESSVYIGVSDESLSPFFHWGDALKFTWYTESMYGDCENRLALVTADDGRQILGTVERYHGDSVFDLRAMNGLQLRSIKVEMFAIFTGALIRKIDEEYIEDSQRYSGKRAKDLAEKA